MIKKFALAAMLTSALALGACGTISTTPTTGTTTTTGDATTDAILAATVKACGFLPTVSTVTGIIASFVTGGTAVNSLVTMVATSICNAVSPKASSARKKLDVGPPTVNNVVVEGRFVS